ncbi:unnamed protein product [Lactuca virosa]|uniref:Uncharacterized protein n=1 Tax=Lactuca virosa TaxID=75947 RepID=A0AAU9PNZ3_9ASTR|nr:unnamed protein product [Lactuca virosa]
MVSTNHQGINHHLPSFSFTHTTHNHPKTHRFVFFRGPKVYPHAPHPFSRLSLMPFTLFFSKSQILAPKIC